jgi:uncharacterized membrane protein YgcG
MKRPEVRDRGGLVYAILVVLGIGTLLPWNVFLTEKEFFDVRLHARPQLPSVASNFVSVFGLVFNFANLLALLLVMCLRTPLSLRTQILHPLGLIAVVMASTAAVALRIDLDGRQVALYALPALALMGCCMAVLQGGMLNLASLFPPIYIQGYVVGAGLSGVATSVLSLAAQFAADEGDAGEGGARTAADVAPAAAVYFAAAAAIVALCACCYHLLGRLEYSRSRLAPYAAAQARAARRQGATAGRELLLDSDEEEEEGSARRNGDDDDLAPGFKDPDALPHYAGHEPLPAADGAGGKDDPTLQDLEWWGGGGGGGAAAAAGPSSSSAAAAGGGSGGGLLAGGGEGAGGGSGKGKHTRQDHQRSPDQRGGGQQQTELAAAERDAAAAANAVQQQPKRRSQRQAAAAAAPPGGPQQQQSQQPPAPPQQQQPQQPQQPQQQQNPLPPPPDPHRQRSSAAFACYAFAITLTMAASLAVFPAVTAFICSVHNPARTSPCAARAPREAGPLAGDLFVPFGFVVFALGDLSGRVLSSIGPWGRAPPSPAAVVLYSLARVALAAGTLFCRVVTPTPWLLPTLVTDDRAAWLLVFALGLTQGHLLSTACMHAPAVVPAGREAEFGPVTGVCITAGCLAGSVASVGVMRAFT